MVSHVYVLRDVNHPWFKIGKANNILVRAKSFGLISIDFEQSFGIRLGSESEAYLLEKILQRTFHFAGVDPVEVIASGGSADGSTEWFYTSCWPRLLRYLKDNQDLHPHETINGTELASLLKKQLEPSQAVVVREELKREKEERRAKREKELNEYRRKKLVCLRTNLDSIHPQITQELDRLRLNGNIAGVCDTSYGSYLVLADRVPLPSGGLLWSLKPLSTHYEYPGGSGSIMSCFSQMTCLSGTISKVSLPSAYVRDEWFSDIDEIICEVFRIEFEWLRLLPRISEELIRLVFPVGGFFSPSSNEPKCDYAIQKVLDALPRPVTHPTFQF